MKLSPPSFFILIAAIGGLAIFSSTLSKTPVLPLFALALQATPSEIGWIVMASTLPGILISFPAGALSDYLGRRRLLLAALVVFATAPFLHCSDQVGLPIIARQKQNLPELAAAVETRFSQQPPTDTFLHGEDRIEVWDANGFGPWETLDWPTVRAMRYRQHKKNGTIIQAEWITNFSIAKLPARRVLQTGQEPLGNREPGIQ